MAAAPSIEEMEHTRRVQECLFRIFEVLARRGTLEAQLAAIHDQLWEVLDASNMYVAVYDHASGLYVFPYNADQDDDDFAPQELHKSLTDFVRRSREPLLCTAAQHARLVAAGEVEVVGLPSPVWLGAPMITARGCIGVVVVQNYVDGTAYGPRDLETLALVARCMAHAVEGAWHRRRVEAEHAMRIRELTVSRDEAVRASAAKSTFLATMSHELRTPLTAILGYAELLGEELEDAGVDGSDDVARIRSAALHLQRVISDILDLSRIEAGQLGADLDVVEFGDLIDDVVTLTRPQIERGNNRLALRVAEVGVVRTDVSKLRQVLANLVANAAAHTQEGTITIRASRRLEGGSPWLKVEVSDTGAGIPPELLPRLFRPFEQGDASATRQRDGTGLGLAICRGFCRLLGGDCTAASVPGSGSTFTVRLPL